MRLISIELPEYKNLRNFKMSLDDASPVAVLVGRNGSGKSNLLEALTLIFRDLDLGQTSSFPYALTYECRGHRVTISAPHGGNSKSFRATVDGQRLTHRQLTGEAGARYRPDHVFGYYSGPSNRLEKHFESHQERFYRALLKGEDQPLRRLFYARNVHSNFVLLSFFMERDSRIAALLHEHLGIESLDSILFVLKKPNWKGDGDPRFWGARGTVAFFLGELYSAALAPLRMQVRVSTGRGRSTSTERLYLYLANLDHARLLLKMYERPQDLFKALESTYISELIHEVRVRVKVRHSDALLTFRELSEGEQQLLLVLGLMRFTREDESLFLLDEPDTHLNPAWSVQYRQFLTSIGGLDDRSHVLMATHDPLVVAGLTRREVRILSADHDKVVAQEPLDDPKGMGVGMLLTSDVYGLRSQLDLETMNKLDRKRELASAPSLSPAESRELDHLARELRELGILHEDRDPEFQEYLAAKHELRPISQGPVLSREEIVERQALAEALVGDLRHPDAPPDGRAR